MDFLNDLENCIKLLRKGQLVGISGPAGWMLAGDASHTEAVKSVLIYTSRLALNSPESKGPVLLLADERSFLQHVSALDLAVFDWMATQDDCLAVWFNGIIGLDKGLESDKGFLAISMVKDDFLIHLIKRLRNPLAVLTPGWDKLPEMAAYICQEHTPVKQNGFLFKQPFG